MFPVDQQMLLCPQREEENKALSSCGAPGGTCSTQTSEHMKGGGWRVRTAKENNSRTKGENKNGFCRGDKRTFVAHPQQCTLLSCLPTAVKVPDWTACGRTLGSSVAVGRQPDEGQRPQGSEREAVRILKRQNLQQSFSPQATFFESALFN